MLSLISKEEFDFVSHLSKLHITGSEKEKLISDMEEILAFAEKINNASFNDTLAEMPEKADNYEDLPPYNREDILKNAPTTDGKHFILPKRSETL